MSEDFGPNLVSVVDEETGEEIELEFVDALEYNGVIYRAFFPVIEDGAEPNEDDLGLIILKADTSGEEEMLVEIDNEKELNAVYDQFMEQLLEDDED